MSTLSQTFKDGEYKKIDDKEFFNTGNFINNNYNTSQDFYKSNQNNEFNLNITNNRNNINNIGNNKININDQENNDYNKLGEKEILISLKQNLIMNYMNLLKKKKIKKKKE